MKEVELKFLEINRDQLLQSFKKLKAKKIFEGPLHALYYDSPRKDLKKSGKVLRLRKVGQEIELTVKQMHSQKRANVMDEYQLNIQNFKEAQRLIETLGYQCIKEVKKKRTSYRYGKNRFELDKFPGVPLFLEIESASKLALSKCVKDLGLSLSEGKCWTTFDVLNHYKVGKKL